MLIDHLKRTGLSVAVLGHDAEVLSRTRVALLRGGTGLEKGRQRRKETHIQQLEYDTQPSPGLVGSDEFID